MNKTQSISIKINVDVQNEEEHLFLHVCHFHEVPLNGNNIRTLLIQLLFLVPSIYGNILKGHLPSANLRKGGAKLSVLAQ